MISLTKDSMKALRSVSSLCLEEVFHIPGVGRDGAYIV